MFWGILCIAAERETIWERAIDSPKKVTVINKPAVNTKLINKLYSAKGKQKDYDQVFFVTKQINKINNMKTYTK